MTNSRGEGPRDREVRKWPTCCSQFTSPWLQTRTSADSSIERPHTRHWRHRIRHTISLSPHGKLQKLSTVLNVSKLIENVHYSLLIQEVKT